MWCQGSLKIPVLVLFASLGVPAGAQEAPPPDTTTEPPREKPADSGPRLRKLDRGYLDDAAIASSLRLRFDSAFGAEKPDRAEFIYGKCDCFSDAAGQDAASPGPAKNLDFQELELSYEHAFSDRFSMFVEVPFRRASLDKPAGFPDPRFEESGLGDIRAGFKYALLADANRLVTFQLRSYFASGDAAKALGTDHASIEPAVLFTKRVSDRWQLASELRFWHPLTGSSDPVTGASNPSSPVGRIERVDPSDENPSGDGPDPVIRNDGFAGDVFRFGVGMSHRPLGSRVRVTPIIEMVGWYFVDGFVTPGTDKEIAIKNPPGYILEADNDTVLNLKLGASLRSRLPGALFVGYGLALTDDELYDGIFRLSYQIDVPARRGHDETRWSTRLAPPKPAARPAGADDEPTGKIRAATAPPVQSDQGKPPRAAEMSRPPEESKFATPSQPQESSTSPQVTPPPAAPPTTATTVPAPAPEEEVAAAVRSWAQAWSDQRLDLYLASYSYGFQPDGRMSRSAWQAQRRERILSRDFIEVRLEEIHVRMEGPRRAAAEFVQHYESDVYSDTVNKRLLLALEGGAWKILREEASP